MSHENNAERFFMDFVADLNVSDKIQRAPQGIALFVFGSQTPFGVPPYVSPPGKTVR